MGWQHSKYRPGHTETIGNKCLKRQLRFRKSPIISQRYRKGMVCMIVKRCSHTYIHIYKLASVVSAFIATQRYDTASTNSCKPATLQCLHTQNGGVVPRSSNSHEPAPIPCNYTIQPPHQCIPTLFNQVDHTRNSVLYGSRTEHLGDTELPHEPQCYNCHSCSHTTDMH